MKQFLSVHDVPNISQLVKSALDLKKNPFAHKELGRNKTIGLIFLNPSLRTRLSTEKAAKNLGMEVMSMNFGTDGWGLETAMGTVMNGKAGEHIKEAAAVVGQYCDIIGVRSFPGLKDRELDYAEAIVKDFVKYSGKPVVSLESSTLHPLQSLADTVTIEERKKKNKPRVVLTWAPHIKALPQAVPNSFAQWMSANDEIDFVITHPKGYELDTQFTVSTPIIYDQDEALAGADFVYAKNWSSYADYGKILSEDKSWMITADKMKLTDNGGFMHCLPVRRNIIVADEVLDSSSSLVINQAGNREFAAQAVLKSMLENN
ncbi:MAG: acetylornithine carbamoyltransferase [Cyclobacteriaceae bacterium]